MSARVFLIVSIGAVSCWLGVAAGEDLYDETSVPVLQLEFSGADWWQQLQNNYQTKTNLAAALTVDGVVYEGVGVRFRGNTSYMMTGDSQKKSFNIEIDYTDPNQRLMGYETLNLINCASDATFMREVLYSNTCRQQVPSAKANFVTLEINGENWGVYANIQQLNGDFIRDWFLSNDGTRWRAQGDMGGGGFPGVTPPGGTPGRPNVPVRDVGGEITVTEMPGGGGGVTNGVAALTWQGSALTTYERVYELKNSKQADPWASLIHVCDVLNNTALAQLPDKLEPVLDVDRALWVCAFEIIFQDDDGYVNKRGSDYCLYYEPETGRMHLIQYDGNESMNLTTGTGWSIFYRADDPLVPLMYRLMSISQYRQRYLAHIRTILDSFFTEEGLGAKIDAYRALIDEAVRADTKKLYTYQAFTSGIDTLNSFVRTRRASILSNREVNRPVPKIVAVTQDTAQNASGQTITVTAHLDNVLAISGVQLLVAAGPFALFTPMPMTDEGTQGEGEAAEHIFCLTLPDYPAGTVLRYYVQATAADTTGTVVFDPPCAEREVYAHVVTYPHEGSSAIVLNEIMARNQFTIADPQGQYDDWIELKNVSDQPIDLSGMYLSDNASNPLKWQFPRDTQLAPGGYLIVWGDEDGSDEPGLHANFKLSSRGETIWLYDAAENGYALLDSATFENLAADQSVSRYPDGTGLMQISSAATPLRANAAPATSQSQ
ncbi:MAG: CotH kinase family protein [Sedimentisphaerales bacterium]|nr:CotH kinase family protein [Sedimentisphaerales bacterium]